MSEPRPSNVGIGVTPLSRVEMLALQAGDQHLINRAQLIISDKIIIHS